MKYTAVADNLTLATAYVKNWLKVDDTTDDTLIADLITIAKEMADDFLQNDFRDIYDEFVGMGDDSTVVFTLDHTLINDLSLDLWVLYAGTDWNQAAFDPSKYGYQVDQATDSTDNDYSLNLTTGVITFETAATPAQGDIVYARHYRLTQADTPTIPSTIKIAVLKLVAYIYENRTGGKVKEAVTGLGSVEWENSGLPSDVGRMLAPYRKLVGT